MRCPDCRNTIEVGLGPPLEESEPAGATAADGPEPTAPAPLLATTRTPVAAEDDPGEDDPGDDDPGDDDEGEDGPERPVLAFLADALAAIEEETGLPRRKLAVAGLAATGLLGMGVVVGLMLRSTPAPVGAALPVAIAPPRLFQPPAVATAPALAPEVRGRPAGRMPTMGPGPVRPSHPAVEAVASKLPPAVEAVAPVLTANVAPPPAADAERMEVVKRIKDATVYLRVSDGGQDSSGSGFVVRVENGTTYVVTNHHVVEPRGGPGPERDDDDEPPPAWPSITAVFRSGDTAGREVGRAARVVAFDRRESRDLAILAVEGVAEPPRPIDLMEGAEPAETTPLLIYGFPFGDLDRLIDRNNRRNPSISVASGRVSSLRRDEDGKPSLVQVDGSINPGNSGGPVVDERGRLVGVAVAQLANANIGFAVPTAELSRMMRGRVGRVRVRATSTRPGEVELDVRAALIDPFGNIRSVEILSGGSPGRPDPARAGWPELDGAGRTALARRDEAAVGIVRSPGEPGRQLTLQACIRDASGESWADRPFTFVIPPAPGVVASDADPGRAGPLGRADFDSLLDPSKACKLARKGEQLTIETPPGVFALGPEFSPRSAPMALEEVEGDFDLLAQVDGALLPGLEPAKHKGRTLPNTYQGEGLILYEDRNNYLRIERGASAQRSRPDVASEVIVEVRDQGRAEPPFTQGVPEGPLNVRIVRANDIVRCMIGTGNDFWFATRQLAIRFPNKVRVGLIATNLSKERLVARFLKCSLTRPEARRD